MKSLITGLAENLLTMASTKNLSNASGEDHVDPWNVTSGSEKGIDYNKLIGITLLKHQKFCFQNSFNFGLIFQIILDAPKSMMIYLYSLRKSPRKSLITCWREVCFSLTEIWTKSWIYMRLKSHSTCTLEEDLALPLSIWVILYHWCLHSINYSSVF